MPQHVRNILRPHVADKQWYYTKGSQENLQKWQFNFESVFRSMRGIGPNHKWHIGNSAQCLCVHWHAAKGSFECINHWSGNATYARIVCRAHQHGARNCLRAIAKRRKCVSGNDARVDITRMRRDQCFGNARDRCCDVGKELRDLLLQTIRITGVKLACYC